MKKRVDVEAIISMYNNNMSQRDIAKVLQCSQPTVGYWLRKSGINPGKGKPPVKGGAVASTIPKKDYMVRNEAEKHDMAVRNAANACLLVEDKSYSLKGQIDKYEVSAKSGFVLANINDVLIELNTDMLATLADELKALARNITEVAVGCEMW